MKNHPLKKKNEADEEPAHQSTDQMQSLNKDHGIMQNNNCNNFAELVENFEKKLLLLLKEQNLHLMELTIEEAEELTTLMVLNTNNRYLGLIDRTERMPH